MIPDKAGLAGRVLLQAASACSLMTTACSWGIVGQVVVENRLEMPDLGHIEKGY
jgi:hypothetical protein